MPFAFFLQVEPMNPTSRLLLCLLAAAWVALDASTAVGQPAAAPPQPAPIDLYDVDAMAAHMPANNDYYQKLRDDLLALYSSQHPTPSPYDDQAREVLRLAAYDMTWGDLYGEGVMDDLTLFAQTAQHNGCNDPLLADLSAIGWLSKQNSYNPIDDARAVEIGNEMISAAQRPSPAALRLEETETGIMATLLSNAVAQTPPPPSSQLLPKLIPLWEQALAELIQNKAPDSVIYNQVFALLRGCQSSASTLDLVSGAIDQAYNETGTASGLRLALDGDYYLNSAWVARGHGESNTVSNQGWQLFGQRIQQAQQILESAYAQYPDEPAISDLMLVVALGGFDRDAMEKWFQRAIKADPNDYTAYLNKAWYLQPRWYGTVEDEWKFAQECAATQNWPYNIPMVLIIGLDDVAAVGDEDIFTREDVWKLTESVYRKYLDLHPRCTRYRTDFLKDAYSGHHQDVVAEQFKILGKDWDRNEISLPEYRKIRASLAP
jgi:tetratricopeptide (TPR) repeat protein